MFAGIFFNPTQSIQTEINTKIANNLHFNK